MAQPLLEVKNLKKYFKTKKGTLHAVDDVSFTVEQGKTLGVVGESGCGKSTTGRTILRLLEPTSGQVFFEGKDIFSLSPRQMRAMRKEMQIIFQDPYASLNPRKTVGEIIAMPLVLNKIITDPRKREERVLELMETVGLAERFINTYPHELDGGRGGGSASASPGHWPWSPSSLYATSRCRLWTFPFRRRFSTC